MTRRRAIAAAAIVVLAISLGAVLFSGAAFTDSSVSTVNGSGDSLTRYLGLYSQSTDPNGNTGYATRRGSAPLVMAATGQDSDVATNLAVNLGGHGRTNGRNVQRVVTLLVEPAPLPRGLGSINIAVTLVPDSTQPGGLQPLTNAVIANMNHGGGAATRTNVAPNTQLEFNCTVVTRRQNGFATNTQYIPHVLITVTYTGFTGSTYYQYDVPVKVYTGTGGGPNAAQTSGAGISSPAPSVAATPNSVATPIAKPTVSPTPSTSPPAATAAPAPALSPTPSSPPSAAPAATSTPTTGPPA
jgi:hypothetical protein